MQHDDGSFPHTELEIERSQWMPRFFKTVERDTDARDALGFLVAGGMDRQYVADSLFWYTHPASAFYQSHMSTRAKQLVPMLEAIQDPLWTLQLALAQGDEDRITAPSAWPFAEIDEGAEAMMNAWVWATDLAHRLKPFCSAKGKSRNEEVIVRLCLEVDAITGQKHWADIAYLLDAAWRTCGEKPKWDQDGLRKVFARYQKAHPRAFNALREQANRMKGQAPPQRNAKQSRSTRNRRIRQPKSRGVASYMSHKP